ncbi:PqqD family protein [Candidatus Parcubacteria bacterium]|nr:PqqD family protein [Candidatus Parcubacteria bacterium]MCG2808974.1 PqqD family protein [Candidatus Portnoybacteria bacterium]
MKESFKPKINCRFRIRQDIEEWIGFFETKGVLTFNEVGAFIVEQMIGDKTVKQIGEMVKNNFPDVEEPVNEVISITKQLKEADFF